MLIEIVMIHIKESHTLNKMQHLFIFSVALLILKLHSQRVQLQINLHLLSPFYHI